MKTNLTIIVEFTNNNLSAYIKEVDGIVATASTLTELKKNIRESIEMFVETCKEYKIELPDVLKGEYELNFKFDLATFLNVYGEVLSKAGLERLTGVNQKQLWHYANGKSKPRRCTVSKVETSVHEFGKELLSIEFA